MSKEKVERLRIEPVINTILLDDILSSLNELNRKTSGGFPAGSKFDEPYQYKTVKAGERGTVYSRLIPGDYVGLISQLALSWYDQTHLDWIVDGVLLERFLRSIPFTTPKEFDPPIKAKDHIRFIAVNKDTTDHSFGVLCDGRLEKKR